jgi:hypothetical protein
MGLSQWAFGSGEHPIVTDAHRFVHRFAHVENHQRGDNGGRPHALGGDDYFRRFPEH